MGWFLYDRDLRHERVKGKCSGAVIYLREVINSTKWINAWLTLHAIRQDWFLILNIFWKK